MKFDLERLAVLAAVAKHGSMTAAAEELSHTPSAVSQQIRRPSRNCARRWSIGTRAE